jgi:hypothetical protein
MLHLPMGMGISMYADVRIQCIDVTNGEYPQGSRGICIISLAPVGGLWKYSCAMQHVIVHG